MEKEILIKYRNKSEDISQLSEEIELLFTMIEELKEETCRQDADIKDISDVIEDTKIKSIQGKKELNKVEKEIVNTRVVIGLGLTSLAYYLNSYLFIGGVLITGMYYIFKN